MMRMDQIDKLTPVQRRRVSELYAKIQAEYPAAEIKSFHVVQPGENDELAQYAFVFTELGYPGGDEYDYRIALRVRYTWSISPKGRVEKWDGKRGFNRAVQKRSQELYSQQIHELKQNLFGRKNEAA